MTSEIVPYEHDHLPQVCELVNLHLSSAVPGWALPAEVIEAAMQRNPGEYVIDPWVAERKTICAVEGKRVVGIAHLLHYGSGDDVGVHYKGAGDISWFLVWPEFGGAVHNLLGACQKQMVNWKVTDVKVWDNGLPVPLLGDIPDTWPHIRRVLSDERFRPTGDEAIFGGWLQDVPLPAIAPLDGLTCQRRLRSNRGFGFSAMHKWREIGWCECIPDLTQGGLLPALKGWAELSELFIEEDWRGQGIGTWLMGQAVEWLRLAGCDRIAFSVAADDEGRGAGRFYERMGWNAFTRLKTGWSLEK